MHETTATVDVVVKKRALHPQTFLALHYQFEGGRSAADLLRTYSATLLERHGRVESVGLSSNNDADVLVVLLRPDKIQTVEAAQKVALNIANTLGVSVTTLTVVQGTEHPDDLEEQVEQLLSHLDDFTGRIGEIVDQTVARATQTADRLLGKLGATLEELAASLKKPRGH